MEWVTGLGARWRVVWALTVREMQSLREGKRLGYLQAYVQPLMLLLFFMLLRSAMRGRFSAEAVDPGFIVPGFALFFVFRDMLTAGIQLGRLTSTAFNFPGVTAVSYLLAQTIVRWIMYMVFLWGVLTFLLFMGWTFDITQWVWLAAGAVLIFPFALGSGLTAWVLLSHYPALSLLFTFMNRTLFWVSGVFFAPTAMPESIQRYIIWNPVTHCLQIARFGLGAHVPPEFRDYGYVLQCSAAMLAFGLLLARPTEKAFRQ